MSRSVVSCGYLGVSAKDLAAKGRTVRHAALGQFR
jgi:hypothetical protein